MNDQKYKGFTKGELIDLLIAKDKSISAWKKLYIRENEKKEK